MVFLIHGAGCVGKTTTANALQEMYPKNYLAIDLDDYVAKMAKQESVMVYFSTIGMEKFYEESLKACKEIVKKYSNSKKHVVVAVGSGSTYDLRAVALATDFNSILISLDTELIWNRRDRPKSLHRDYNTYYFWHFNSFKKSMYKKCKIKIDTSYLTPEQVAENLNLKIRGYVEEKKVLRKKIADYENKKITK